MVENLSCGIEKNLSTGGFTFPNALDIYKSYNLSSTVPQELKQSKLSSSEFLQRLIEGKCYADAVNFLAHGLPKPLSLKWAYDCLISLERFPLKDNPILEKIKSWLDQPDDQTRRFIGSEGNKIGFDNPLGWLAMAIFCEGSITPEDTPETLPQPSVVPHMIAGVIILAAVQDKPQRIGQNYNLFLNIGMRGVLMGILKEEGA